MLYGPDTSIEGSRLEDRAERVEYVMIPTAQDAQLQADWAAIAPAFELVDSNDYWLLYHRNPAVPLPLDWLGRPVRSGPGPKRTQLGSFWPWPQTNRTQRGPRMRRPGSAPVNSSWSTVCTPATNVAT